MMRATRLLFIVALCGAFPWFGAVAQGQGTATTYPSRPIRLIIPFTAGGMADTLARTVAQHLMEHMAQPVVAENRPGANGAIALEAVAKSPPDGYTLIMGTQSNLVLLTAARKSLPYDPLRDITSITTIFAAPLYLVVHPSVPARSVQELIAQARSQPGKLAYASLGMGSAQHLAMELFKTKANVDLLHVPYKGSAPAMADLLGGQVQAMFEGPTSSLPHVRTGKLRALASTGPRRTLAMPDLPTVIEAGVPGFEMLTWFGLSTTAGVSRPIIDRINLEVGELLRSPSAREKFAAYNIELIPSTPEEMNERIRAEIPTFTKVMRAAGIEPE